jgi:hypothetical protein
MSIVNLDLLESDGRLMASSAVQTAPDDGKFREQRRRKTNSSEDGATGSTTKQGWSKSWGMAIALHPSEIPTRKFFAPFRAIETDTGTTAVDGADSEPLTYLQPNPVPKGVGRPLTIILTTSVNLLNFHG